MRSCAMRAASSWIGGSALVEVLRPLRSFFGLKPVLVASQLDEPAFLEELLENSRHVSAQPLAVGREILDEEVGDQRGCRAEAGVADAFVRKLADQEDERADARLELAVGRSVIEPADELVDLLEQDAALQHARRTLIVKTKSAPMTCADRLVGDAARGLVDDLQLRAQHAGLAGLVDRAQRALPEAPAGRKQRIVGDEAGLSAAVGSSRVPPRCWSISPLYLVERRLERRRRPPASCAERPGGRRSRRPCRRARPCTAKRSISFCSVGVRGERACPVATTSTWLSNRAEQPSTRCWTCSAFSLSSPMYCCISSRTTSVSGSFPSVVALQAEHVLEDVEHLVVADVLDDRELRLQRLAHLGRRVAERCARVDQRLGERGRDVEVAKLVVEGLAGRLDCRRERGRRGPRSSSRA